ncbi:protein LONGIFOLIA 2-like [Dendrobium catenatum]|uniref:Protein LONGIFOLIA 2 n=1 Tax=Dendrobium catenatum TaxID=906689 RepID=A0A2I0W427_9ASPA|nr:protein LONGIFOLIA 2-like [Dendrobium catenatum]XP_020687531.1 protein LONGIFOLIA 2-like [Dendrobium catenatum]PKU70404.1 Protein LONGIFOLIA 2 [Dendrobium catenatum]
MTPSINCGIPDERNLEKQIERQMGCMTGFLQLFDRHQILAGKRLYSDKRISSSPTSDSLSPSERSDVSSSSFVKAAPPSPSSPSPAGFPSSPENHHQARPSLPLPLPVFEVKDGVKTSWKLREAPRLSLDSRAVFDAWGKLRPREIRTTPVVFSGDPSDCSDAGDDHDKHRRSPSVVARLMGLDTLPVDCNEEQPKRSELRRSSSESRVSRDHWQFNFQKLSPNSSEELFQPRKVDYTELRHRNSKPEPPRAPPDPLKRKSFFEAQDFFPEPKRTGSMYEEIEKRLRMRGIEEPAKDLETLKQILEALQLKGLLHSKLPELSSVGSLDVIDNHELPISAITESPIIHKTLTPKPPPRSAGSERLPLQHRSVSPRRPVPPEVIPSAKSRRDPVRKKLMRPSEPNESSRTPISAPERRRSVNVEGQRSYQPERRVPSVHSPVASPKKPGFDQVGLRSPRIQRPKPEISKEQVHSLAEDDAFSFSNTSTRSPPSQIDFQRATTEEFRTGRTLLERCDKLLHSIAAITSSAEQVTAMDQQPSPVSVLDSSFLSEENSASSLPKLSIDFKDQIEDWEDHRKHKATPSAGSEYWNGPEKKIGAGQGDDYAFVADVVRETDRCGGPANLFSALEQRHRVSGSSVISVIHRRHVFDTVTEIVERKRSITPWVAFICSLPTAFAGSENSLLLEVWEEVQWLRDHVSTENVMELTGQVIKQDMAMTAPGEQNWTVPGAELSAAVLHIERQLFKDLVADTIRELADMSCRRRATTLPRRKLIF